MTDTSTQAVEAMAERILRAAGSSLGNYTLYRQNILDQVRYAMDYGNVVERASARRTALEDAAKVAKSLTVDTTGAVAEYMIGKADGMRFAAKEIYTAICALIEKEQR